MTAGLVGVGRPDSRDRTTAGLVRVLAVAYALTIANLYYCQPLLPRMGRSFGGPGAMGDLVTAGQGGYALGLVLVVPLGDIMRRRPLVCGLLCAQAVALTVTATAPAVWVVLTAGVVIGVTASGVVQVLLPYAASVAPEHERGRAMATIMIGSQLGVLSSRTVAGLVGGLLGWRGMFLVAAVVTVAVAGVLARVMTSTPPEIAMGYAAQLRATVRLAVTEPVLRRRSAIGACVFGCLCAVWATMAFLLSAPPYGYGSAQIGLVALAGAAGAVVARPVGGAADRGWQRPLTGGLLVLGLVSFAVLWEGRGSLWCLIPGLLALGAAVSGSHLLNTSVVYGLVGGGRSRIAAVYMTAYTLGGVVGSAAGTEAYGKGGWGAVCAVGAAFMAAALAFWLRDALRTHLPEGARR